MSTKPVSLTVMVIVLMGVLAASFNVHKVEAFDVQLVRPVEASTLTPHSPIYIFGDSGFVPASGVTGGSGISEDPYIIEGWDINASHNVGIMIRHTRAHFIIRNVFIHDGWIDGGYHGISLFNVTNGEVSGASITRNADGILLSSSLNNSISGNNITNNGDGISLSGSSNNTVSGNNITANNGDGISLSGSSNNTVSGNNITANNWDGIQLDSSSNNNTLTANNVEGNPSTGIRVGGSMNNVIFGNNVVHSDNGIDIVGVLFTTISRNHIAENNQYGIILDAASNNTISANNITNNDLGIFYDGLCNNNTGYHNNFIDNAKQVEVSPGDVDAWDDGVEGNYWSNYAGVDSNYDGIGDSWYNITQNNTDHYPLMGMFHSFNTTLGKYVNVISNSTIDSFRYFESNSTIRMHVSNMTADQTHGFCRVSIPYEVMSEPFNVAIDGANPTYWNYTLYDNGTHRWIYFEYEHTTREIVIVPEFPSFLVLPLFMTATLLAVIVSRRN